MLHGGLLIYAVLGAWALIVHACFEGRMVWEFIWWRYEAELEGHVTVMGRAYEGYIL